jgi:hypothetical protein
VVSTSDNETLRDASAALRRGGGDGLLVAVLGSVDPEEARLLARLRHGSTAAIAVMLETATWASTTERARAQAHASYEGSVALMRASGWRVVRARAGDSLADLWPDASRHHVGAEAAPGAAVAAGSAP